MKHFDTSDNPYRHQHHDISDVDPASAVTDRIRTRAVDAPTHRLRAAAPEKPAPGFEIDLESAGGKNTNNHEARSMEEGAGIAIAGNAVAGDQECGHMRY